MNATTKEILSRLCKGGYMEGVWLCQRALIGDKVTVLATPNAEMLHKASRDAELSDILVQADILFPDGFGAFAAMRRMGLSAERCCGIELFEKLLQSLSARGTGTRIFLLGGKKGVAERAAKELSGKYKGVTLCGTSSGYFDPSSAENETLLRRINDSRAEIVAVCMGFPRQERWMLDNRHRLPSVRLMMGLGGSLDIWSGNIPRAPEAVRSMGLEWAYRAVRDPRRLTRLPALVGFAADIAKK